MLRVEQIPRPAAYFVTGRQSRQRIFRPAKTFGDPRLVFVGSPSPDALLSPAVNAVLRRHDSVGDHPVHIVFGRAAHKPRPAPVLHSRSALRILQIRHHETAHQRIARLDVQIPDRSGSQAHHQGLRMFRFDFGGKTAVRKHLDQRRAIPARYRIVRHQGSRRKAELRRIPFQNTPDHGRARTIQLVPVLLRIVFPLRRRRSAAHQVAAQRRERTAIGAEQQRAVAPFLQAERRIAIAILKLHPQRFPFAGHRSVIPEIVPPHRRLRQKTADPPVRTVGSHPMTRSPRRKRRRRIFQPNAVRIFERFLSAEKIDATHIRIQRFENEPRFRHAGSG